MLTQAPRELSQLSFQPLNLSFKAEATGARTIAMQGPARLAQAPQGYTQGRYARFFCASGSALQLAAQPVRASR